MSLPCQCAWLRGWWYWPSSPGTSSASPADSSAGASDPTWPRAMRLLSLCLRVAPAADRQLPPNYSLTMTAYESLAARKRDLVLNEATARKVLASKVRCIGSHPG